MPKAYTTVRRTPSLAEGEYHCTAGACPLTPCNMPETFFALNSSSSPSEYLLTFSQNINITRRKTRQAIIYPFSANCFPWKQYCFHEVKPSLAKGNYSFPQGNITAPTAHFTRPSYAIRSERRRPLPGSRGSCSSS